MKYFFSIIIISLIFSKVNAQEFDREGAIVTKEGYLLYYNYENPFTINLIGDVDFVKYPTINIDGNLLEINDIISEPFGETEEEILSNVMKWEINYLEDTFKQTLQSKNRLTQHNGRVINLWNFSNPALLSDFTDQYNQKAFYSDFYFREHVYRLAFMAFKGTEEEAKKILLQYTDNIHFYNEQIDINKLREAVMNGQNKY